MGVWSLGAAYDSKMSGPNIVTNGLIMHVDAGNPASYPGSGTTWTDLSGTISAGTLSNVTYNSANGGYMSFAGTGTTATTLSYAAFPNNTVLDTQTPTVELWVKPTYLGQPYFWFEKGIVNQQYEIFTANGYIYWRMVVGGSLVDLTVTESAAGVSTTSWNHITATYASGTGRRIYRNATLVASDSLSGTIATNGRGVDLGAYFDGGGWDYRYNGGIAICRVYNRALSITEIQQNYDAQKTRFGL